MKIVGIDASTNKTGMSLFSDAKYIKHTLIDLHTNKQAMSRIKEMMMHMRAILNQWKPDKVIMEESLLKNNIQTVKMLSYIAGAVIEWCTENAVAFEFTLPSHWRRKIGLSQSNKITREQLKQEAIDEVKKRYGIEADDDSSEAILIAASGFCEKVVDDDEIII